MKILIIAGGHGTRLWPLSRERRPKQLQALFSEKSLLQETFERTRGLVDPSDVFLVVSNQFQVEEVAKQLPEIPIENILQEPEQKNTLAAITYGMAELVRRGNTHDVVAVLYADHVVENAQAFRDGLTQGEQFLQAEPERLLVIGVTPTSPEIGYGYIEKGEPLHHNVHAVVAFKEKPDRELAENFLNNGSHLWNAGMFQWKVSAFLNEIQQRAPKHADILEANTPEELANIYANLPTAATDSAIDYVLFENNPKMATLPLPLKWRDIGHWEAIKQHVQKTSETAVVRGKHVGVDTKDTLILSDTDRLITTVGVEGLVIIDTPDALLVCKASEAQKLKQLVDELKQNGEYSEFL